jgi:alkaline phosphatase
MYTLRVFLALCLLYQTYGHVGQADWSNDMNADKWYRQARDTIDAQLKRKLNRNVAKNVILFLGDGMGMSTVTAGRILKGQLKNQNGEEEVTNMEMLDHVGLAKVLTFLNA